MQLVFFHPESNFYLVSVLKLVKLREVSESYNLVPFMSETEKQGALSVLKADVNHFYFYQSTRKFYGLLWMQVVKLLH